MERFRYKKLKARQAQAKLTQIGRLEQERAAHTGELARLTTKRRTLGFEFLRPKRSGRTVVETDGLSVAAGDKQLLERCLLRARARRARRPRRAERHRQDHTARDHAARRTGTSGRCGSVTASSPRTSRSRSSSSTRAAPCCSACSARPGLQRPDAQSLLGRFLFSGWDEQTKPVAVLSGGERRRLALALVVASGRTSWCSTSRPTTSTSRAARRSRRRSRRSPARSCSSRTTARCSTPSPSARSRSRTGRCTHTRAAGRITCAGETSSTSPEVARSAAQGEARQAGAGAAHPPRGPSELQRVESEIAEREEEVARLERELAENWTDVDRVAAHRRARDELQQLLVRWEQLFEAQASG